VICGLLFGGLIFVALALRGATITFGPVPLSTSILLAIVLTAVAAIVAGLALVRLSTANLSAVLRRE
jgi:hypothetical protein